MKILAVGAALACLAASAGAQRGSHEERGGFVTQLGNDTIGVERFVRTRDSIVGEVVGRSPKTRRFTYVMRLDRTGAIATCTVTFFEGVAPGSAVRMRADADLRGPDSIRVAIKRGDSTAHLASAYVPGAVPVLAPSMGSYEAVARQAIAAKGKRIPFAAYYLGDIETGGSAVLAAPDLVLVAWRTDTVRVHVDRDGRVTGTTDPGGTFQAVSTRISPPDIDKWGAQFTARDAQGKSLGTLSPRDTVRVTVGEAHVQIDYGRPSKRGRTIFGGVVPYNSVWRTGANEATTLVVDHDITMGDTKVPAGEYTLFSLPTADSWTLIISKKTKEWGTDYDPTADLARIPCKSGRLSNPSSVFRSGSFPTACCSPGTIGRGE